MYEIMVSRHWMLGNENSYNWEMGGKWGTPVDWFESILRCAYKEVTHVEPGRNLRLRRESLEESEENEETRIYRTEPWRQDSHTTLQSCAQGAVEYLTEYWSVHACDEFTQGWGENTPERGGGNSAPCSHITRKSLCSHQPDWKPRYLWGIG